MSHYTADTKAHLVMAFKDQNARNAWAKKHRKALGHSVLEYLKKVSTTKKEKSHEKVTPISDLQGKGRMALEAKGREQPHHR